MPKVSIIMNCYNGAEYLNLSLESVFAQTYSDWEIIFIDNCSTDNSAEIAKSYGRKLKYYKTELNIPLYAARNIALEYISGEFTCFLDVDDLWSKDKLEKQLKLFDDKDVGFVFTGVEYIDSEGQIIDKKYPTLKKGWITQSLLLRNYIAMSSSMVRTSIFLRDNFNSDYNLVGDHDFWLRISRYVKADCIMEKLFISRLHKKSTTNKNKGKWIYEMRRLYKEFYKFNGVRYPNIFLYILKCELANLIRRY